MQSLLRVTTRPRLAALSLLALSLCGSAFAGDLGISVTVSGEVAPGVYGQVTVGDSKPSVVYSQPVVVHKTTVVKPPLYLHVPPGHLRQWDRYCDHYHACDRQVYFVRSSEYRDFHDERRDWSDERREDHDHHDDDHDHGNHGDHGRGHGHGH